MDVEITEEMQEAFERFYTDTYKLAPCSTASDHAYTSLRAYQAATASAEAKYLPVIEKLVEAIQAAKKHMKMQFYLDEYPEPTGAAKKKFYADMKEAEKTVSAALAEAAPLLRRK